MSIERKLHQADRTVPARLHLEDPCYFSAGRCVVRVSAVRFRRVGSARLPSCPPCHHTRSPGRAARAAATPRVRHGRRRRRHAPDDVVSGGHAGVGFSDRQVRGDVERVAGGPHVVRRSGPDLRPRLGRHRGRCPQPGGVRELVRRRQVVQCEERERRVRARVFGEWRRVSQRGR